VSLFKLHPRTKELRTPAVYASVEFNEGGKRLGLHPEPARQYYAMFLGFYMVLGGILSMIVPGNLKEHLAWKDMVASRRLTQELQAHYRTTFVRLDPTSWDTVKHMVANRWTPEIGR